MPTNNYTHKYLTNGCWPQRPIAAIKKIVIHHTAAAFDDRGNDERLQQHADFEVKTENWPGLSYHYMIMKDGQIYQLNEFTDSSYTDGINYESLAICLDGYFHADVNNQPTPEQLQSLQDLLDKTISDPNGIVVTKDDVVGHREHIAASLGGTACPGDLLMPYVIQYRTTGKIINNQPATNSNMTDLTQLTDQQIKDAGLARKQWFYDGVGRLTFDEATRTNLINSISQSDYDYLLSFSGSEPRKLLATQMQKNQDSQVEIQTLIAKAATLNQAQTDLENKLSSSNTSLESASKKVQDLELRLDTLQQNSSTKPVWASKKVIVTALASIGFTALAAYDPNTFLAVRNSPIFPMVATYLLGQSGVDIANIINQTNVTDASKK